MIKQNGDGIKKLSGAKKQMAVAYEAVSLQQDGIFVGYMVVGA